MMRYRLRTLLIVLALGPPVLAAVWFALKWDRDAAALERASAEKFYEDLGLFVPVQTGLISASELEDN